MVLKKILLVFIAVILWAFMGYSQNVSVLKQAEDSVNSLYKRIKTSESDTDKENINSLLVNMLGSILVKSESFQYLFDSLKWCGKVYAPDKQFRIFTWSYTLSDGTYMYSGILQFKVPKSDSLKLHIFNDKASEVEHRENSVLSAGKWFGGLYYKILKNKINQINYYTILSLRYNNLFTTSKVIEVLYFDEFGNPVFGAPLFTSGKNTKLRMVFEYSANVVMKLNYDEDRKMIVFDHLSPSDPRFAGQFEYYGPDSSYDGFVFKNNKWNLVTNLDIKNNDSPKNTPPKRTPVSNKIAR